jgi:hypothetical protein
LRSAAERDASTRFVGLFDTARSSLRREHALSLSHRRLQAGALAGDALNISPETGTCRASKDTARKTKIQPEPLRCHHDPDVRFGSKADIRAAKSHVRFATAPKDGP